MNLSYPALKCSGSVLFYRLLPLSSSILNCAGVWRHCLLPVHHFSVIGEMPASLSSLPFDLVHVIASSLDVHDFVHLSCISKRYQNLLQNESMARRTLQVCHFSVLLSWAIFDAASKPYYTPGKGRTFATVGKDAFQVARQ